MMRTTVTLEPDVVARLRKTMRERNVSFKEALNDAVRAGLQTPAPRSRPYRLPSRRLGLRPGIDVDRALALAAELEDADIVRKLELRK